jgi:hypothetical protein
MGIIEKLVRKKCLQLLAPLPTLSRNNSALIPFPASQFAPTLLEGELSSGFGAVVLDTVDHRIGLIDRLTAAIYD